MNTNLSRILIDIGSSLNVMLKTTLMRLTIVGVLLKSSSIVVRAFDGCPRFIIGEVDLPIKMAH